MEAYETTRDQKYTSLPDKETIIQQKASSGEEQIIFYLSKSITPK